jgi:NADH-quinone oxidoreductase subunit H
MLLLWSFIPSAFSLWSGRFSFLVFFCVLSLGVYFLLFCGWGSGNKYALSGSHRGVSQSISYEVSLLVFALCVVYLFGVFDFFHFVFFQGGF